MVADGLDFIGDNLEAVTTLTVGLGAAISVYKIGKSEWFSGIISGLKGMKTAMAATTTATNGATVATKLFNMVCNMSPLGKVLVVITAATAAIAAFKVITSASNSELVKEHEEIKALGEEMDSLTESVRENQKRREEQKDSVEAEWMAYQSMSDMLYKLAESEEKTTAEKEKMNILVGQLNEAMPELNLSIDEQTGALNLEKEAVEEVIGSMKKKAVMAAMEEQATEILKEQAGVYIEVTKAETERLEIENKIEAAQKRYKEALEEGERALNSDAYAVECANNVMEDCRIEIMALEDEQKRLDETINKGNEAIEASTEEFNECMDAAGSLAETLGFAEEAAGKAGEAAGGMGETTGAAAAVVSESYQNIRQALENSLNGTASLFEEFNAGQQISTGEMLKNLESQRSGYEGWGENMKKLAGATGEGMTEELLTYLAELGPEGANAAAALVQSLESKDGEFERVCQEWTELISIKEKIPGLVAEYYDAGSGTVEGVRQGAADKKPALVSEAYSIGTAMLEGIGQGIRDKTPDIMKVFNESTLSMYNAAKRGLKINSPSRLFRDGIGKWIPLGVAEGIMSETGSLEESTVEMCAAVVNTAMEELEIHSPSKVFRTKVGRMVTRGMADGIRDGKKDVKRANQEMTTAIYKDAVKEVANLKKQKLLSLKAEKEYWIEIRKQLKIGSKEYEEASKKIRNLDFSIKINKKGNFGVSKKDENGITKSAGAYSKEVLEKATAWLSSYQAQQDMTVEQEAVFWRQIRKQLKKGTAAYKEATKNMKDAQKSVAKERLSASDKALSQYKTYYKVSAKAEVEYWNIVRKQFKAGTEERIEADQRYYEAKESLNSQLEELNEEYVQNCADVQERLEEDVKSLTDAYNDAVKERADSIYSSFGLFDKFRSESESGEKLLYNLRTQVAGIADWELQLRELAARGLPKGLMEEFQEMGPEASASLHALNSLTDKQLKEYAALWEQKHALADAQAVKELEPMRKETQAQIKELTNAAKKELSELKKEYTAAIKELNKGISSALKKVANSTQKIGEDATAKLIAGIKKGAEKKDTKAKLNSAKTTIKKGLSDLPKAGATIGTNTLKGIVSGLTDKKTISASARLLVENLKKEIQKAADIHSPSRLFRKEIGMQLSAGVAEGIIEESVKVNAAGEQMIRELMETTKSQIGQQEGVLKKYAGDISGGGLTELQNLIQVAPVQQVSVRADDSSLMAMFSEMLAVMQEGFSNMGNMQMVTDTGALIGELKGGMSTEFAKMSRRKRR